MKLIIAEKPSVAKDIANVLGGVKRHNGFVEANGYTVTWAVGHLVTLADAFDYDEKFKRWNALDLPIVPNPFQLKVIASSQSQFHIVAGLLKKADEVIVATDAGREGQLIYELISAHVGYRGITKRLWLSSMTEAAIRDAFTRLKDNSEYENLYFAGFSRAQADWLVGINATRAMTVHAGTLLTIGRVQTPTLAMIVRRDQEIEHFQPVPYFEVEAVFVHDKGNYKGKWLSKNNGTRLDNQAEAALIVQKVQGKEGIITKLEQKTSKEQPPQLFDLTTLQRKANQRFGFTADQTLKITQSLYETHKVLSYPRTDSRYISEDVASTLQQRLESASHTFPDYKKHIPLSINPGKRVVNAAKVTDHHAIIPTEKVLSTSLKSDEHKIYELVVQQTIAALMEPAEWASTTIETAVEGEVFKTTGRVLTKEGFRAIMGRQDDDEEKKKPDEEENQSHLPNVAKNDSCVTDTAEVLSKMTKPLPHFSEATLLGAMENAGKQVDDAELAEALKERGLGTPATRASIIEKLKRDEYIIVDKKKLLATEKGRALIDAITVPVLLSPEMTGDWEYKLKQMEHGHYTPDQFIAEIVEFTRNVVQEVQTSTVNVQVDNQSHGREVVGRCPLCGGDVVKTPKGFGCVNWRSKGCKFTVWQDISGHKMTSTQVKELLAKGKTKLLKFTSRKTGKDFEALLVLKEGGKVEFEFLPSGTEISIKNQ